MGICRQNWRLRLVRYFRTSPAAYAQLQPAIDDAFRAEVIDSGRCENILPVTLAPMSDGLCYIALAEWMTSHPSSAPFLAHPSIEEITQQEFTNLLPSPE